MFGGVFTLTSFVVSVDNKSTSWTEMASNTVKREDHTSTNPNPNCKELKANDPNERLPHCQRCAQHNLRNRLRGHKAVCPFRECGCQKCVIVVERQRLMADQIKLRRRQRKQRNLHKQGILTDQSTSSQTTATDLEFSQRSLPSLQQPSNDLHFWSLNQQYAFFSLFGLDHFCSRPTQK
ncbi:DM DNA binding domain protein [Aphelenchoides besseyi]|nr:DM DNA binding domain protein [Aphelenchoides besseyi]KAI6200059.1 DM DNA binding domain protein [Aphelenchoides besseyi]